MQRELQCTCNAQCDAAGVGAGRHAAAQKTGRIGHGGPGGRERGTKPRKKKPARARMAGRA